MQLAVRLHILSIYSIHAVMEKTSQFTGYVSDNNIKLYIMNFNLAINWFILSTSAHEITPFFNSS